MVRVLDLLDQYQIISRLDSQCKFQMFTLFPGRHVGVRDYSEFETNHSSGRVETLNPRPLDNNTSALNHSAKKHGECILDYSYRNVNSPYQLSYNFLSLIFVMATCQLFSLYKRGLYVEFKLSSAD